MTIFNQVFVAVVAKWETTTLTKQWHKSHSLGDILVNNFLKSTSRMCGQFYFVLFYLSEFVLQKMYEITLNKSANLVVKLLLVVAVVAVASLYL